MASTTLMTYLNYMSTWDTESDANINSIISEQNLFISVGNFDAEPVIDKEFNTLIGLADTVRDTTIAADATQMAADVAAVASIWSFGLGMAAFVALETSLQIEKAVISSKSKELNSKLQTVDTDISSQINDNVNEYVKKYKENNNLINSKAPIGLDKERCRSILFQFMADIHRKSGKLDIDTFRQYAESARIVFNSDEIQKVYDALDELNFSQKSDEDVSKCMNIISGLKFPEEAKHGLAIVQGLSISIMAYKMRIANKTISECAKAADIPLEEVDASAFGMMDCIGKFTAVVAVAASVVDIVLDIIDIVDVVEQTNKMCDKLNGPIKDNYKSYFDGIRNASIQYNLAISPNTNPSVNPSPEVLNVITGVPYSIKSVGHGTVLDDWGGKTGENSAALQPDDSPDSMNRAWYLITNSNGFRIKSVGHGTVLDDWGGKTGENSAALQPDDSPDSTNRIWSFITNSNGFRIKSVGHGTVLDDWGGKTGEDSAALQPDDSPDSTNRTWTIHLKYQNPYVPNTNNQVVFGVPYLIKSVGHGTVLDDWGGKTGENSAALQPDDSPDSMNRTWYLIPNANGFRIKSVGHGTVLDDWGGKTGENSAALQPDDSPDSMNRTWCLVPNSNGFLIKSVEHGTVLDDWGGKTGEDSAALQPDDSPDSMNRTWIFHLIN